MTDHVMTTYMIVFDPNLEDYEALSTNEERRRARNEMLIEFAGEMVVREQMQPGSFPSWDEPVAIEVDEFNMSPTQLMSMLVEKAAMLESIWGEGYSIDSVDRDNGTYYYYRHGIRMCHRGYNLLDASGDDLVRMKQRTLSSNELVSLRATYRVVVEHEPLPM